MIKNLHLSKIIKRLRIIFSWFKLHFVSKRKLLGYSEDLEELNERLEEQMMVVEEAQERVLLAEEQATNLLKKKWIA